MDSANPSLTKCVKDAYGNCSRWCTHAKGKPKKVADEVVPTLVIGGTLHYSGGDFDVNNVRTRTILTDRINEEQTVELLVVLTRSIRPTPKDQ